MKNIEEFLNAYKNPFVTVFVNENDTIIYVLQMMKENREDRLVYVLNSSKALVGIISMGKLARHVFHEEITPSSGFLPSSNILDYLRTNLAKDIMETDLVTCILADSVESLKEKMLTKEIKKMIPVVDEQMHVIGSISIITLMEYILKEKGQEDI